MANNGDHGTKGAKNTPVNQWVMVILTFLFVALYACALFGWIKPLTDDKVINQLAPIITAIIGYYFGRVPAQQNEKTLKEQVDKNALDADKAREEKDAAQQESAGLQQKVQAAKAALSPALPAGTSTPGFVTTLSGAANPKEAAEAAAVAAYNVLNS